MTHLYIEQNGITEEVSSSVISKLYELASSGTLDGTSNLKGRLHTTLGYRSEIEYLNTNYQDLYISVDDYAVPFEDPNMLSYLLNKGIGSNGYITETQAAAVTSVSNAPNTTITKFNEFKYFTNITESKGGFSGTDDGNMRFLGWTALEEIDISNLTSIGHNTGYAYGDTFVNCTSLKKVTASDKLAKIGYNAFDGCTNLETLSGLDGVVEIWDNAFDNCEKLQQSSFQSLQVTLKTVGAGYNFANCKLLSSINISNTTTEIPKVCFYGCTNLSSISIPSTVTTVSNAAFHSCTSLADVDIDWTKITEIGAEAFRGCSNLVIQNIDCPNLTVIGQYAFESCRKLEQISNLGSIQQIGAYAFLNCSNLQSAVIPNTVTGIPRSCFDGCSNLTTATLPSTITIIDREGFYNCENITTINTTNVTEIGYNAFKNCTRLQSVDLSNCTKIYNNAFNYCTALTSIGSLSNVTRLEDSAFIWCSNIVGQINMPNLTYLGAKAFYGCRKITQITIPSTITNYGESLFRESGITSFTIPSGVTIGPVVFRDCTDLQTVVIGSNTGASCFFGCSSLSNVTIQEGVTELASQSFRNTAIIIIDLPSTITSIGSEQFRGCDQLNTIIIRATTPPTGNDWYAGLNGNATIYVPDASVNDYKASTAFSALSSRIFGISQLPQS